MTVALAFMANYLLAERKRKGEKREILLFLMDTPWKLQIPLLLVIADLNLISNPYPAAKETEK